MCAFCLQIMTDLNSDITRHMLTTHPYSKKELITKLMQQENSSYSAAKQERNKSAVNSEDACESKRKRPNDLSDSADKLVSTDDLAKIDSSQSFMLSDIELTKMIDEDVNLELLEDYLEKSDGSHIQSFVLDDKAMKYYEGLDIRSAKSRNSCCFTKR